MQTTVNILNGAVISGFVFGSVDSIINVSGGSVWGCVGLDSSVLSISGGLVDIVDCSGDSRVNISGGTGPIFLSAFENSAVTIVGTHFNYRFGPISDTDGWLTGTLQNGDSLDVSFLRYDNASIILVPEPATTLLLVLGWLVVRRRKR